MKIIIFITLFSLVKANMSFTTFPDINTCEKYTDSPSCVDACCAFCFNSCVSITNSTDANTCVMPTKDDCNITPHFSTLNVILIFIPILSIILCFTFCILYKKCKNRSTHIPLNEFV